MGHLNKFKTITTQLTSVSINFDNEVWILIILSFLFESKNGTFECDEKICREEEIEIQ